MSVVSGCSLQRCLPEGLAVDEIVRSVRFENETGAARKLDHITCEGCSAPCVGACTRARIDRGVDIPTILSSITAEIPRTSKADLSIDFVECIVKTHFFFPLR